MFEGQMLTRSTHAHQAHSHLALAKVNVTAAHYSNIKETGIKAH